MRRLTLPWQKTDPIRTVAHAISGLAGVTSGAQGASKALQYSIHNIYICNNHLEKDEHFGLYVHSASTYQQPPEHDCTQNGSVQKRSFIGHRELMRSLERCFHSPSTYYTPSAFRHNLIQSQRLYEENITRMAVFNTRKPKLRESEVMWPRPRSTCRSQDRVQNLARQSQARTHQATLPPERPPQLSLLRTLYGPWLSHGRFQDPLLNSGFLKF